MISRTTACLVTSFSIISLLGIAFLLWTWSTRDELAIGVYRSVMFVVMMAAVHAVGYELYVRQFRPVGVGLFAAAVQPFIGQ